MEDPEDYERSGLNVPRIALTNFHPFDANRKKHKQHIGLVTGGATVVYSEDQLEGEKIGLLSPHERSELEWATSAAKRQVAAEHRDAPYCVSPILDMN